MSQPEGSMQAVLAQLHTALFDSVEARCASEGFPKPATANEWVSWLLNEALSGVHQGALMGHAPPFARAATLLETVAVLKELGVHRARTIQAFPLYLFQPDASRGVAYNTHAMSERARRALSSLVDPLRHQFGLDQFLRERCEQEQLLFPRDAFEWTSMLINDGCFMAYHLSPPLSDAANEVEVPVVVQQRRIAMLGAGTDNSLMQMACDELRCVAALYQAGIHPARRIPVFPFLRG